MEEYRTEIYEQSNHLLGNEAYFIDTHILPVSTITPD